MNDAPRTTARTVGSVVLVVCCVLWLLGALAVVSLLTELTYGNNDYAFVFLGIVALGVAAAPGIILRQRGLAALPLAWGVFLASILVFFGVCLAAAGAR